MKKILFLISVCLALFLIGCEEKGREIRYWNSYWRTDNLNRTFSVDDGYILSESNPYDKIETEDGYDMILHFEKVGD